MSPVIGSKAPENLLQATVLRDAILHANRPAEERLPLDQILLKKIYQRGDLLSISEKLAMGEGVSSVLSSIGKDRKFFANHLGPLKSTDLVKPAILELDHLETLPPKSLDAYKIRGKFIAYAFISGLLHQEEIVRLNITAVQPELQNLIRTHAVAKIWEQEHLEPQEVDLAVEAAERVIKDGYPSDISTAISKLKSEILKTVAGNERAQMSGELMAYLFIERALKESKS
jgi:hypothetical protein